MLLGLAQRFHPRRNPRCHRCPDCLGSTAEGDPAPPDAPADAGCPPGARQSRCARPDHRLRAAIWGTAGIRQWIVVFLAFCVAGNRPTCRAGLDHAGGRRADRLSRRPRRAARQRAVDPLRPAHHRHLVVFLLSALCGGLFGFRNAALHRRRVALVVAGFIVQGNFSNLTSGVLAVAAPRHLGATIGALFLHRLRRRVSRNAAVRRHTRSVRRCRTSRSVGGSFATCGIACLAGGIATALLLRRESPPRPIAGVRSAE